MKNIGNRILNILEIYYWQLITLFSTIIMRSLCVAKSITIGNGNVFYGLAKFKRGKENIIKIGNNCTFRSLPTANLIGINRPCIFSSIGNNQSTLSIGNNCGFSGTVIGCFSCIQIGNNVRCGANSLITDSDWHTSDCRLSEPLPITIQDNVFLGVNTTVLKGVTIGKNTIVGAGSVVSKDIPANVIAAGNPCNIIKTIKFN